MWNDPEFLRLCPKAKLVYSLIYSMANDAGIAVLDSTMMAATIGGDFTTQEVVVAVFQMGKIVELSIDKKLAFVKARALVCIQARREWVCGYLEAAKLNFAENKEMERIISSYGAKGAKATSKQRELALFDVATVESSASQKSDSKRGAGRMAKATNRFEPPTFQQVKEYSREQNNTNELAPEMFFNHYEGNGWYQGVTKMRDWRAAFRNWMIDKPLRNNRYPSATRPTAKQRIEKVVESVTPEDLLETQNEWEKLAAFTEKFGQGNRR